MCVVLVLLLLYFSSYPGVLRAQSTNGSIAGRVTDPSKAVIAVTKVAAISEGTNARYYGATNDSGEYYFTNLPPGIYRIEIEKTGFKKVIKSDVILHGKDSLKIDFELVLNVSPYSETAESERPKLQARMGPIEGKSTAVLTLPGMLGIFQQSAAGDDRAPPLECSQAEQDRVGTLSGTVSDISGTGISDALITASCGSFRQEVETDSIGAYSLQLSPGRYRVSVTANKFNPAEREVVLAATAPVVEWKVTLSLATVQTRVFVTAGPYAVTNSTAGSKMDAPLLDVPQSIAVVDHALLSDQGVYKLDEALKNVAGVMPGGYYEAWDYYRIRGFDASFNTFVDGLRGGNGMAEEIFGLESVEVLKGPSSTLYGQSVLGGIVNLRSKVPRPDAFAQVQFTGGSYGFYEPAIDAGAPLNPSHTLYARINVLYRPTGSFVDYVNRHRVYVAPALTWIISPQTQLTLLGRYQHDTGHLGFPLPAEGTVLPNPNGQIPISLFVGEPSSPNPVSEVNKQFGYQLSHQFNDSFSFYQNVRVDWYENYWDKLLYPSTFGSDERTLERYPLSYQQVWSNYAADTGVRFRVKTGRIQHNFVSGVDFYREPNRYNEESIDFSNPLAYMPLDVFKPVYGTPFSPIYPFATGNTRTQDVGLYLQDRMELTERFSFTAGGRVDFASNRDFSLPDSNDHNAFSPRVGGNYQLVPGVALYADYSTSFLPQTGMVYDGSSSGAFANPERGDQWEGGVKTSLLSGRLVSTVSVYRLTRDNVLTPDPNHPNFYVLTGKQRSKGVELETTFQLHRTWNLILAYAFTDAKVVEDNLIPAGTPTQNVPRHSVNVWSTYELQGGWLRGVGFGFGARYYTDQSGDLLDTFSIPAYGLMDASIFYRQRHLSWQVNAYNLADKRYFTGSYNNVYVQPGSPRSIRTTIGWIF
jgi:iron complex outermembrane recepter protein